MRHPYDRLSTGGHGKPGSRERSEDERDDSSHWAGPGLVCRVCKWCGRVGIDLGEPRSTTNPEHDLGVDALLWPTAAAVR